MARASDMSYGRTTASHYYGDEMREVTKSSSGVMPYKTAVGSSTRYQDASLKRPQSQGRINVLQNSALRKPTSQKSLVFGRQ